MHHLCQHSCWCVVHQTHAEIFLVPDCYACLSGKHSVETARPLQKENEFWNLSFHFHSNGSVCGALMGCKFGFKALPQDLLQFPHRQWLDAQVNTFLRTIGLQDWRNALFLLRDEFKGQWTRMGAIWALLFPLAVIQLLKILYTKYVLCRIWNQMGVWYKWLLLVCC